MSEFTKEEINLCKQVADTGERRALRFGDFWFHPKGEQRIHVISEEKAVISLMEQQILGCYPLWTISDCLEFLNQANSFKTQLYNTKWNWYCKTKRYEIGAKEYFARGKTPLETCLKAVLAVLEEKG